MPTILLDMDEVLVDFIGGACQVFDITRQQLEEARPNNQWDIVSVIGCCIQTNLTIEAFWEEIHGYGKDFWIDLKPLPWAEELMSLIRETTDSWYIVSAPSNCHSSYTGKIKWLKNYFGKEFDKFVLTPHKHLLAKSDRLLIDDRLENVCGFLHNGGNALLFASTGNKLYPYADDPVRHLSDSLDEIWKYIKALEGVGQPKQKYDGGARSETNRMAGLL